MGQCKVEMIADSIGPNGSRVTTIKATYGRPIHSEVLRHRLFSSSVASSRALKTSVIKQVETDPWVPVYFPKKHAHMQGSEVWEPGSTDAKLAEEQWLHARDEALKVAKNMEVMGVSNQIFNRLLEPWMKVQHVITSASWDNFFMLRAPWHYEYEDLGNGVLDPNIGNTKVIWEDEVNLNFPAEYNIQDLAIKIKAAMGASTPVKLGEGGWHLPFVDKEELWEYCKELHCNSKEDEVNESVMQAVEYDFNKMAIDISAARSARTSYGKNLGKTIEDDLALAKMLRESNHWSPFEHQAQATALVDETTSGVSNFYELPKGMELRIKMIDDPEDEQAYLHQQQHWSRNFQGWIQARSVLDEK